MAFFWLAYMVMPAFPSHPLSGKIFVELFVEIFVEIFGRQTPRPSLPPGWTQFRCSVLGMCAEVLVQLASSKLQPEQCVCVCDIVCTVLFCARLLAAAAARTQNTAPDIRAR